MQFRRRRTEPTRPAPRVLVRVTCGGALASTTYLDDILRVLGKSDLGVFVLYDAGPPDARVAVYLTYETDLTGVDI